MMGRISESGYIRLAFANFIILTFFGVLLRYMQVYSLPGFNYQYLLHAHSHFAFAGWMFLSLAILVANNGRGNTFSRAYKAVFICTLISAFGMLITFSLQGYRTASIAFSTLFILITYRFSYLVIRGSRRTGVSGLLIYSGLGFLCISSLGPFAMAPLIATGFRHTPVYQNAIYFYLHFQMNGFMLLTSLGLFASSYLPAKLDGRANLWLSLFIFSTIPLFTVFTLWANPAGWVWLLAMAGAVLNMLSWVKLWPYVKAGSKRFTFLVKTAMTAITIKVITQVLICFPVIGEWTFLNRNLIIGYVHLLTLACIVPLILDQFVKRKYLPSDRQLFWINRLYILTAVIYLSLLFIQPVFSLASVVVSEYQFILLLLSFVFLLIGILYLFKSAFRNSCSR